MMKKIGILLGILCLSLLMVSCKKTSSSHYYVIGLKVNPDIDIVIDEKDKVVSYYMKNEDAKIVASSLNLVGMHYQQALILYLDEVIKTGYIDVNTDLQAVLVSLGHLRDEPEQKRTIDLFNFMFDYFKEKMLPVVVLNQLIYDESISNLAKVLNLSNEQAKVYQALALLDPSILVDSSKKMSSKQIFQELTRLQKESIGSVTSTQKQEFLLIKDELIDTNEHAIVLFEEKSVLGEIKVFDYSELRTQYQQGFEQHKINYEQSKLATVTNAMDLIKGNTPSYLVGEYVFEYAIGITPYIINYYIINLYEGGTGRVRDSTTSKLYDQIVTGNNACYWTFSEGHIHITYQLNAPFSDKYLVRANRLIYTLKLGFQGSEGSVDLVFKRTSTSS